MLTAGGNLTGATTVSAFKGPSPPWGSHPYAQFLFRQPGFGAAAKIAFATLPSPAGIYNWDVVGFIEKYQLGKPVARNYHMTQHMAPRE
jgi:hypothetical protein